MTREGVGARQKPKISRGRGTVVRTSRHAVVLKLRSIAPAMVPVAMNGAFGANATVAHRFTCFTYGCWYAIVASPRTAPPRAAIIKAAAFQNGERPHGTLRHEA